MIRFNCPNCSRAFTVRDQDAGRRAKCKTCGNDVVVPQLTEATDAPPETAPAIAQSNTPAVEAPKRIPMRIRRLTADADQMQSAFAKSPYIRVVSTEGSPPELYRLEYNV